MGRNYLPADAEKMFEEAKDYKPIISNKVFQKAGLLYEVIQSNNRVRALCTTDETKLEWFASDEKAAEEFVKGNLGRRKIKTQLLKDYSFTMNTDCGAGLGGHLIYQRHSIRISQPILDFFSFEIAAANAFILRRGKDVSYTKGVRRFTEEVIEETVHYYQIRLRLLDSRREDEEIPKTKSEDRATVY